ncbi:DUF998 domain-containing protein [Pseudonocardia humida]|uniref:DUF998 domain-containing protein n=1 Tax=Pseudonocardia humida TaxID=2800819 RepID=A0ABT1ADW8_9PSEU|nr:DUF998 domain-containing protein [Pseudonocardia humida]MCO1661166.1 DUF998 domain-containing protein [Pseudonocardia humida]
MTATPTARPTATSVRDPRTRLLLSGSVAAVGVFGVVSLTQAATREGFDLTRFPLSALSNGDLGWVQITNFVVSGVLAVAGAVGLHRVMRGTPGGTWAPRLVAVWGIGLILSGPFVLQGGGGFPVGDPGVPGMTVGTIGHLVVGTVAFAALIASCFVLGRHYARSGERGMALGSRASGSAFLVGDLYSMAGGPAGALVLAITALTAMAWVGVVAHVELRR